MPISRTLLVRLRGLLAVAVAAVATTAPGHAPAARAEDPAAPAPAPAPAPTPALVATSARFGAGDGPVVAGADGVHRLLDAAGTKSQSNAIAFDRVLEGARSSYAMKCRMRVLEGGDGGAFVFLSTAEHGARGPAPFVKSWTDPNLPGAFAVGIDVHNPKNEEMFSSWGNYQGLPEREVSLHWDGREIVKRVAPAEFRGDFRDVEIAVEHVCGGAEVTVRIAGAAVYEREFIADMHPYEMRPAIGAGTRSDASTQFDVSDVAFTAGPPAPSRRPPLHVEVFHHVRTDNSKTAFESTVDLPPAEWAFGRVVLTLEIHDAGLAWDEWDRNGEVSVFDDAGTKLGIVPFITSYRTPCRWKVDVTHFRPLLAGKRRFEVAAGTTFYKNRGYQMSVSLDFHHGMPAEQAYRVVPLWHGIARHGPAANHFTDFFTPRTADVDASAARARIFMTTTGHSQIGEFTPSRRTVTFRGDRSDAADAGATFEDTLWKSDCYLNPNRPQFGTWKFSRAGWAPGDVVRPWWIDVTPQLRPGKTAEVSYVPHPYDFSGEPQQPKEADVAEASHVVRSYLVLSRKATDLVAAPTMRILDVVADGNAAKAGLRAGDWLATYDGAPVDSSEALRSAIRAAEAEGKKSLKVTVFRGSERREFEVPPGRMGVSLGGS